MKRRVGLWAWICVPLLCLTTSCTKQEKPQPTDFVAFDAGSACTIVVPEKATEAEMRAARLLQETLAKAAGRPRDDFAIVHQAPVDGMVLSVRGLVETAGPKLQEWVAWSAQPGRLELSAYPADAVEAAAAWFLERQVGARWFAPGAIGEKVPPREFLRLAPGEASHRPSYISRTFWFRGVARADTWSRRNRLRGWFEHGHMMNKLFKPGDLRTNPALAPLINGQRYFPSDAHQQGWQPNIALPAAAMHAARRLKQRLEFSSSLGMNDGIGYDQSEATRRALDETQWFRMRPDFSPLVFRFTNEVAKRLPDRYLGAYAYYWTEDAPAFPVEKNVVPYLTADRSEWLDADFAEGDKALIKRWVTSGVEVVGLYDYYYGAPFFVPRPTLYAATEVIPFASEAGVKAFFAELNSNWALDGPKAWIAAQLLWDSKASPDALLNTYYSEFWREAAGPMRAFYARCDEQWRHQPKPTYWIKYYKDEHQYLLFPPEVRRELRGLIERAMAVATTELTRNRLRFVSAGFAVTEAFCTWNETRDRLSRAALGKDIRPDEVSTLLQDYGVQLDSLRQLLAATKRQYPEAIQSDLLGEYTRNDPRRRAEWRLGERATEGRRQTTTDDGQPTARQADNALSKTEAGGRRPEGGRGGGEGVKPEGVRIQSSNPQTLTSSHLPAVGPELLQDSDLAQLVVGPTVGFFDLKWVQQGPWRGQGEPYQTRRVFKSKPETGDLRPEGGRGGGVRSADGGGQTAEDRGQRTEDGRLTTDDRQRPADNKQPITNHESPGTSIVFTGCKQDMLSQVVPGVAGKTYVARVKVQGKVSPGNMTFMILNFQDAQGRTLGLGTIDRLPVGTYDEPVELICTAVAPPEAAWVGMGVKAMNQVLDDEARFTGLSLREIQAP